MLLQASQLPRPAGKGGDLRQYQAAVHGLTLAFVHAAAGAAAAPASTQGGDLRPDQAAVHGLAAVMHRSLVTLLVPLMKDSLLRCVQPLHWLPGCLVYQPKVVALGGSSASWCWQRRWCLCLWCLFPRATDTMPCTADAFACFCNHLAETLGSPLERYFVCVKSASCDTCKPGITSGSFVDLQGLRL